MTENGIFYTILHARKGTISYYLVLFDMILCNELFRVIFGMTESGDHAEWRDGAHEDQHRRARQYLLAAARPRVGALRGRQGLAGPGEALSRQYCLAFAIAIALLLLWTDGNALPLLWKIA
jgi:hypothetical protein